MPRLLAPLMAQTSADKISKGQSIPCASDKINRVSLSWSQPVMVGRAPSSQGLYLWPVALSLTHPLPFCLPVFILLIFLNVLSRYPSKCRYPLSHSGHPVSLRPHSHCPSQELHHWQEHLRKSPRSHDVISQSLSIGYVALVSASCLIDVIWCHLMDSHLDDVILWVLILMMSYDVIYRCSCILEFYGICNTVFLASVTLYQMWFLANQHLSHTVSKVMTSSE